MRLITAGESHGKGLLAIVDSPPAGISLSKENVEKELARRRAGYGRGKRMGIEKDSVEIISGVYKGKTIGSPLAILIENTEHSEWEEVFSKGGRERYVPRPGHADYAGFLKYGYDELRPVIERASARSTAAVVAAGALFKNMLKEFGVEVYSAVTAIGPLQIINEEVEKKALLRAEENEVRIPDESMVDKAKELIDLAASSGTTLGGKVLVAAFGVIPGLGSYVTPDKRADSIIASYLMSIPSVKAVEIGRAIKQSLVPGSEAQDEFEINEGKVSRTTNNAGGIEGGVTNGEVVYASVYFKPIPTQKRPLKSFDIRNFRPADAFYERSDVFVGPAIGVIAEAWLSFSLAKLYMEKFGADSIADMRRTFEEYCRRIDWVLPHE